MKDRGLPLLSQMLHRSANLDCPEYCLEVKEKDADKWATKALLCFAGDSTGGTKPPSFTQQCVPLARAQGDGGGEPDLSISISHAIQCIVILGSEVKIRSATLWSLAGRKPAVFYQPRLSWLSQQPVPQHTHFGFSADAP